MNKQLLLAFFGFAALATLPAVADEATVKKTVESAFGLQVENVTKSGYMGLYEIYANGQIMYTDERVTGLLVGSLVDAKTKKIVSAERMKKLTAVKFSDLPLDKAIKTVRGDGSRVMATFEDPHCGYCKRLAGDLQKLDIVTIYTFLYPILSEASVETSKKVWCSTDRARAWNALMVEGKMPEAASGCQTPIQDMLELGRKLNIGGTPTLVFASGERIPGAVTLDTIEQRLAATQR